MTRPKVAPYYNTEAVTSLVSDDHTAEAILIKLPNGNIMHIFRLDPGVAGDHMGNDGKLVRRTYDISTETWGSTIDVADYQWEELPPLDVDNRNPAGGITADGRIVVWFRMYDADTEDTKWRGFIYSDDEGATWSARSADIDYLGYGKMIYIPTQGYMQGFYSGSVIYIRFSANGSSWGEPITVASGVGEAYTLVEPTFEYIGDGTIVCLIRDNDQDALLQVVSTDYGATWGSVERTNIVGSEFIVAPYMFLHGDYLWVFGATRSGTYDSQGTYLCRGHIDNIPTDANAWEIVEFIPRPITGSGALLYGYEVAASLGGGKYLVVQTERTGNNPEQCHFYQWEFTPTATTNITSVAARIQGKIAGSMPAEDDFEWGSNQDDLSDSGGGIKWTTTTPNNAVVEISTDRASGGTRSAKITRDSGDDGVARISNQDVTGYEAEVYPPTTNRLITGYGDGSKIVYAYVNGDREVGYRDDDGFTGTGHYITADAWSLLRIRYIDFTVGTYQLWVGSTNLGTKNMYTSAAYGNQIIFAKVTSDGTVYIDNVKVGSEYDEWEGKLRHREAVVDPTVALGDDFEWGSNGDDIAGSGGDIPWTNSCIGNSTAKISTAEAYSGTRSLAMYRDGTDTCEVSFARNGLVVTEGIQFMLLAGTRISVSHGDGGDRIWLDITANGDVRYYSDGSWYTIGTVTTGIWHKVRLDNMDWVGHTYDVYVGDRYFGQVDMRGDVGSEDVFRFINYDAATTVYLDDVQILTVDSWTETAWKNTLATRDTLYEDLSGLDAKESYEFQVKARDTETEADSGWSSLACFLTRTRSAFFPFM